MPQRNKKPPESRTVCLINPSSRVAYGTMEPPAFPPMGLQYIAAMLEKGGFDVKVIDIDADGLDLEQLGKRLAQIKPFLLGVTCTTPLFKQSLQICRIAKKSCKAKTCLGGMHPTIKPMEGIKDQYLDFLVFGEGEHTFLEIAQALAAGKKDFSGIKGLVYKKNGKPVKNQVRPLVANLDELPFPARHLFKMERYTYPDALKSPAISIMTSRGCPGQCTYCCTKCIFGLSYRFRSAGNIIQEIEQIIEQYGAKEIHIWDDNFTVNKKRVMEFCEKVREKGIHKKVLFAIPQGLRIDQVNEEVLRELKSINVYSIGYGVESGDEHILKLCKKNTNPDQARKAIGLSKKLGFDVWAFFMIGLYGDTEETIRKTIDFAKELDPLFAKFPIMHPLPGTEVFDQLEREGLLLEHDYERFGLYGKPVHKLPGVSPERMVELQQQAMKEFYLRPHKIVEQLSRLRSWHRFKLNVSAGIQILKLTFARGSF